MERDLVVVGGGLAGVCCAITAAREGLDVVLVQDRPVLGGNASSEVRLWILGATSHMGNNNRWAREGGVIDELLVENLWRNPEGNPVLFDSIVLEFVHREPRIRLLLNTAVDEAALGDDGGIVSVSAYCSQNQQRYTLHAPLFCDASGDGVVGFLAGAAFRIGAEAHSEFGEGLAPAQRSNDLLGHSLYFYSRDTGRPVTFVAPSFALQNIEEILHFRELRATDSGCRLWWLEYGGALETIYETEAIKWELWRVAYGVWNYIKNSGAFPDAETLTLEWMGMIPGKRESRRFEGDYMLTQQDVVEQRSHADAVSCGGWAIDLHPSEGVYSELPACTQWHSKGVYQIPYRSMYSRNVPNLFLAGRLLSASHIAFGSTRVMATCAHNGQAIGMAAVLCQREGVRPRRLAGPEAMRTLQQMLLRAGQHIPGVAAEDPADKARSATVSASSSLQLNALLPSGETAALDAPVALLVPLGVGPVPVFTPRLTSNCNTMLRAELWTSSREGNFTPDVLLASIDVPVAEGEAQDVALNFEVAIQREAYVFVMLHADPNLNVALSEEYICGVLTVSQKMNAAVAKTPVQIPPAASGIDAFAFWLPDRRPAARNLAVTIAPPLACFEAANVTNGFARPWTAANAWLPDREDRTPGLTLRWTEPQAIRRIQVTFDTDFDHPMESVLMGHPERRMPGCASALRISTLEGKLLAEIIDNHQTRIQVVLDEPVETLGIVLAVLDCGSALPAIYEVRCY
jgi:hypothetical protein